MREILTVSLSREILKEVDEVSRRFHLNRSELVKNAIRKYLWSLRFKMLRNRVQSKARKAGFYTDEDVFGVIS